MEKFFLILGWATIIMAAEHQWINALELCCWRRFIKVPWTAWRSNQTILKEISSEYSLEGLMLKLKLHYFDTKSRLIGKDPDVRKDWRQEEKGMIEDEMVGWHHQLNGHDLSKLRKMVKDRNPSVLQSMGSQRVRNDLGIEQQQQNVTTNAFLFY